MNITYFFRPKMKNAHSIEGVFEIVMTALADKVEINRYDTTNKWKRLYSFFKARQFQGDINHITGDIHMLALFLSGNKTVLTIHDIGHLERDLKGVKKYIFKILWLYLPCKKVRLITTISSFTKGRIVNTCGIPECKIKVIPNPAPQDFAYHEKEFEAKEPVILQIGSGNNKNIHRLITAVQNSKYRLLLIRKHDSELENLLKANKIPYEWYSNISRTEVYECYKKSDIVFFASEYEGFGVPILEANQVGRVVITSNLSSMPEVAGDSCVLVDPYDSKKIREAIDLVSEDTALREKLIKKGKENVLRFDPTLIAGKYLSLYKELSQ
ncbi:glycosyltransferase family 1 protein [Olivibacter sp. XZL3]|uniref:glycosyltransferase family 4 protein n=1 Tax=Olivibacter sp. XZL3 TaxID=1735116 RepID=UPI0010666B23|nr:glycosyltransferase family 1 protein [Olivibacter sp. XZL3]